MDRCPECMSLLQGAKKCPHCGAETDSITQKIGDALPAGTIIQQRYMLGAALSQSRQAICYAAWDQQMQRRALVEEFAPTVSTHRMQEQVVPRDGFEENFAQAAAYFKKQPVPGSRPLPCYDVFPIHGTVMRVYGPVKDDTSLAVQAEELLDDPILFLDQNRRPLMSINALKIPPIPQAREPRLTARGNQKKKKQSFVLGAVAAIMAVIVVLLGIVTVVEGVREEENPTDGLQTVVPTAAPTEEPTATPTEEPTAAPTEEPTATPTEEPTATPTEEPTATPTEEPTATPTVKPTATPTEEPTATPTEEPTATPTEEPTATPTVKPTATPTVEPTATPTVKPTATPTVKPTATPTVKPTATPTAKPTATPTVKPTVTPTVKPTATPTVKPTATPTVKPTATPTVKPTATPTVKPTATPTVKPTATPTAQPTATPATATLAQIPAQELTDWMNSVTQSEEAVPTEEIITASAESEAMLSTETQQNVTASELPLSTPNETPVPTMPAVLASPTDLDAASLEAPEALEIPDGSLAAAASWLAYLNGEETNETVSYYNHQGYLTEQLREETYAQISDWWAQKGEREPLTAQSLETLWEEYARFYGWRTLKPGIIYGKEKTFFFQPNWEEMDGQVREQPPMLEEAWCLEKGQPYQRSRLMSNTVRMAETADHLSELPAYPEEYAQRPAWLERMLERGEQTWRD